MINQWDSGNVEAHIKYQFFHNFILALITVTEYKSNFILN